MTRTVDLTKEQEAAIQKQAADRGASVEAVLRDIVDSALGADGTNGQRPPKDRVMGLHAGIVTYIADDFDDELPDSFWLGDSMFADYPITVIW